MDFLFYVTIVIVCSLVYYGYLKKKDTDLKMKKLEVKEKEIELEILKHKETE